MKPLRIAALIAAGPLVLAANSAPQPVPVVDMIPAPRDIDYPGTIVLKVDATDLDQGAFKVRETVPVVQPGRITLLMPKWLPGHHAPRGQIEKLANLVIRAGGKTVPWTRDPVNVYAFDLDVPEDAKALDVTFDFLSATEADQGRVVITREMLNLQWESVSLYPAGWFTRRIPVSASVTYPSGWKAATALRPATTAGNTVAYETVSYEVLQDSPVFAGRYFRRVDLGQNVALNIFGDTASELAATPADIALHRRLVDQAVKLFGARHFDHYDFLLAITDRMGGIGLEHHRSSEDQVEPGYFIDVPAGLPDRNLLPHEFTHSWNGKFRRGADAWTPDFRTPMRDSLLWVYEGQTQFWGYVLQARSGLSTKADVLDGFAAIAASLDNRPGRQWRPLIDTTNDPIISARKPKGWISQQRSEDYYNEGLLIWLEADAIIRERTGGTKGMDDFARAFFGTGEGDWGEVTYDFDDVVRTLEGVTAYDWRAFLIARLNDTSERAPLGGIAKGGYRLMYTQTPSNFTARAMTQAKLLDLSYSVGLTIAKAKTTQVLWGSPAFKAGLTVGQEIIAVNGSLYTDAAIKAAITAAKGSGAPLHLTVKRGDAVRDVTIVWNGGLRYPHLEKVGAGEGSLDRLLAPR